jgi:hypothetical protein
LSTSHPMNTPETLAPLVAGERIPASRVWGMLALRSALSFGLLLALAGVLKLAGRPSAISASAAWWLWFVTVANIACIVLMARFSRMEGMGLLQIYHANRSTWRGDLVWALIAFAGSAVLAQPPGTILAGALWGDPNYPNSMLFQSLPLIAIYPLFLLMPPTQALAELPIYWGYVAPRLQASGLNRWIVIVIVGAVLSIQHMFFSFQLDWRYDLWLAVKFFPFALWTGFVIHRRPSVMPYLMAGHLALDALLPYFVYMVSTGAAPFG